MSGPAPWSLERLLKFCRSHDANVHSWASDYIRAFYPRPGTAIIADLLKNNNPTVRSAGVDYAFHHPSPEIFETLWNVFREGSRRDDHTGVMRALLTIDPGEATARYLEIHGFDRSETTREWQAIDEPDPAIRRTLGALRVVLPRFRPAMSRCPGFPSFLGDLYLSVTILFATSLSFDGSIFRALDALSKTLTIDFRPPRPLGKAIRRHASDNPSGDEIRSVLPEAIDKIAARIAAVAAETIPLHRYLRAQADLQVAWAHAGREHGSSPPQFLAGFDNYLTLTWILGILESLPAARRGDPVTLLLAPLPDDLTDEYLPREIAEKTLSDGRLSLNGRSRLWRRLIGDAAVPLPAGLEERIAEDLQQEKFALNDEPIRDLALRYEEDVVRAIVKRVGQNPEKDIGLIRALYRLNRPEAGEILANRFDTLATSRAALELWDLVEWLGDPLFSDRMSEYYRPGEPKMAGVLLLLHALAGTIPFNADDLRRECSESKKYEEKLTRILRDKDKERSYEALRDIMDDVNPPIPLRCRACGRTYRYDSGTVLIVTGWSPERIFESVRLTRIVVCKSCRSLDDYEWIPETERLLLLRLSAFTSIVDREGRDRAMELTNVAFGDLVFGREKKQRDVRTAGEGIKIIQNQLDVDPNDFDLWIRLGNLHKNGGLPDRAVEPYRRALELNPHAAEACYNLAEIGIDEGRFQEAKDLVIKGWEAVMQRTGDDEKNKQYMLGFLMLRQMLRERGGIELDLWASERKKIFSPQSVDLCISHVDFGDPGDVDRLYRQIVLREPVDVPREKRAPFCSEDADPGLRRRMPFVSRNDPCPCGSGRKYKKCCAK